MSLSPKCPEGFNWVPLYGNGKSCFKQTENVIVECAPATPTQCYYDITIADMLCQVEKGNTKDFLTLRLSYKKGMK